MKIKHLWFPLVISSLLCVGLKVSQSIVTAFGGEFFMDQAACSVTIFALLIASLMISVAISLLDRETPKTCDIGKNRIAGISGMAAAVFLACSGIMNIMSPKTEDGVGFFDIITLFGVIFGAVVLFIEAYSSFRGKNMIASKPLLALALPIMFALRLYQLFFVYSTISLQSSEMFDLVSLAVGTVLVFYQAILYSGIKDKSCIKPVFVWAVPYIAVTLTYSIDSITYSILSGSFSLSASFTPIGDLLLCVYFIALLVELTKFRDKFYAEFEDEEYEFAEVEAAEQIALSKNKEKSDREYTSFDEISSFGKNTPHIHTETITTKPAQIAAAVEPKEPCEEKPEEETVADTAEKEAAEVTEPTPQPQAEQAVSENPMDTLPPVRAASPLFIDKAPKLSSEKIPTPISDTEPVNKDEIDIDRINRLIAELESEKK